eukprot:TRINITY_DN7383_c0_g1_i4.p1 TRINITY_DN7383_c0_g1~~TRINITY_DN7383_c0_g1_i4.p1  ORF type:complete len:182 (+),score=10.60 TRINITY_DN7383_c0_g1_i4:1-546(+)
MLRSLVGSEMCIRDSTLDFSHTEINDEGCKGVGQLVNHFSTTLINLHLNFSNYGLRGTNEEGLQILGDVIRNCSNLTHLTLNFSNNPISDTGVGKITRGLSSLSQLILLHLSFDMCYKLKDRNVENIVNGIQQCRSTLTQLSLFLWNPYDEYGHGFSDVGHFSLPRFLPTLTRIQELSIHW